MSLKKFFILTMICNDAHGFSNDIQNNQFGGTRNSTDVGLNITKIQGRGVCDFRNILSLF